MNDLGVKMFCIPILGFNEKWRYAQAAPLDVMDEEEAAPRDVMEEEGAHHYHQQQQQHKGHADCCRGTANISYDPYARINDNSRLHQSVNAQVKQPATCSVPITSLSITATVRCGFSQPQLCAHLTALYHILCMPWINTAKAKQKSVIMRVLTLHVSKCNVQPVNLAAICCQQHVSSVLWRWMKVRFGTVARRH